MSRSQRDEVRDLIRGSASGASAFPKYPVNGSSGFRAAGLGVGDVRTSPNLKLVEGFSIYVFCGFANGGEITGQWSMLFRG